MKSPSRNDGGSSGISEPGGDEVYGRGGRRGDVTRSRHLSGQFLLKPIHLRLHLPHLGVRQMRHCQSRSSLVKEDRGFRLLRYQFTIPIPVLYSIKAYTSTETKENLKNPR